MTGKTLNSHTRRNHAGTRQLQIIGEVIREKLKHTKFACHVDSRAWEYTWMDGFRVAVSEELNLKPGDKVLDVGCGEGWFSIQNALKHPSVEFLGVDLFEAREAEEVAGLVGVKNCRFHRVDALNMHIREKVDHVVFFMSLGNICETPSDVERLLRNCWESMKDGAKLLIVEPFEEDFPEEVREKLKKLYKLYMKKASGEDRETILSREMVLTALRNTGFKVVKTARKSFKWHMDEDEVARYFGLEKLPFKIPGKFWVHDKPKQVTIILATKNTRNPTHPK